jgi:hypothetical protein
MAEDILFITIASVLASFDISDPVDMDNHKIVTYETTSEAIWYVCCCTPRLSFRADETS